MLEWGFYNMDCMEGMKEFPDKFFDLAIVDPEYGNNSDAIDTFESKSKNILSKRKKYHQFKNEIPSEKYFIELNRISKNQIVWGGNYFGLRGGYIVWDKEQSWFGECELAYCSLIKSVRLYRYRWNGMIQQNMKQKEIRIHPTQKPVAVYRWLLKNFAKPNWKLIDTHVGSASSLIAFEWEGFCDYVGFEIDEDYYRDAKNRLENWRKSRNLELFKKAS